MPQFVKHFVQDLTQDIKIRQCGTIVFNGDNLSNVITIDLYNGTEPYSGGGSVSCSVICPDGATVPITNGSISGNTVTVTLTGDCFAIPGQIGVGVQVVSGDIRTTVLKAIYNVELLETDTIVDPGSRITASVGQLVSDIEAATAEIPASDMASLMAGIAPTFSASINYNAGAYVYYNGTLYRFTADHAAGSWTGTDATAVALGNDLGGQVSDLKSALNPISVEPNLRNGSVTNIYNAQQVATGQIIPFAESTTVTIIVNKNVTAPGNYWRLVFDTFSVANGKPEDNASNRVTLLNVQDKTKLTIYKGFFDETSVGFAFSIAEKTANDETVTHRIGDFIAGDIVIIRDYVWLDEINNKIETIDENEYALQNKISFVDDSVFANRLSELHILETASEATIYRKYVQQVFKVGHRYRIKVFVNSIPQKPIGTTAQFNLRTTTNNGQSPNIVDQVSDGALDNLAGGESFVYDFIPTNTAYYLYAYVNVSSGTVDIDISVSDSAVEKNIVGITELAVIPEIVNGTTANPSNAQQVSINKIIPFEENTEYHIIVNKPVSDIGNYYRLVFSTYTVDSGNPSDNTSKRVTIDQPIDSNPACIYQNMFDDLGIGFAFSIAEKKADGTILPLRITDFLNGDIVITKHKKVGGSYQYYGQKINLSQNTFNMKNAFITNKPSDYSTLGWQGHSIYGNKLLRLLHTGIAVLYDITDAKPLDPVNKIAEFELGSYGENNHANNCNFSNIFYHGNTAFPLLYLTDGNSPEVFRCSVENITEVNGIYSSETVQTITLDQSDFDAFGYTQYWGWPAWIVDADKALYVFGTKYRTTDVYAEYAGRNKYIITKFAIPDTSISEVTLTAADVIEQWTSPYDVKFTQGGGIAGDYLVYAFGDGTSAYPPTLKFFSLTQKKCIANIPFADTDIWNVEPEDVCAYNNSLIVGMAIDRMYRITFPA